MNLLDQLSQNLDNKLQVSNQTIIVCTHAKYSTLLLCKTLMKVFDNVVFYPVDYSYEPDIVQQILALDVVVVSKSHEVVEQLKNADCGIEDGARLSKIVAEQLVIMKPEFFMIEQTSGGIRYHIESPAPYPVIDVAFSSVKLHIENSIATPEGVLHYFYEATQSLLSGKTILIIGFGSIGEGLARLCQTLGGHVTVYDNLATKRLFAKNQGYNTVEPDGFEHILAMQQVIFMATNTYQGALLGRQQLLLMRDQAIICNAGSGRGEITPDLQEPGSYKQHEATVDITEQGDHLIIDMEKYGAHKQVTILAKAFPINLHIGKGTSHDAIEVVMALMLLAAVTGPASTKKEIQPLSQDIQQTVAKYLLQNERESNALRPTFITSTKLPAITKPYGSLTPFHNQLGNQANISVAKVLFKARSKTRGHYHAMTQESYYAERGSAMVTVWPADYSTPPISHELKAGDYLLVPENYYHDVSIPVGEDFECIVIASPAFDAWDQFFKEESINDQV